jgi:hypothetical protein
VAVVGDELVAVGPTAREVYDKAKKLHPKKTPFIMKVPTGEVVIF